MARKRNRKPQYVIQNGKFQHHTTARRFTVWLHNGLIELADAGNRRLARVSAIARTVWENGELFVLPKAAPTPSVKTNAEIVDRQYIYADAGQVRIARADRSLFADWRVRFGLDVADSMIAQFLATRRDWDMRAQFNW